MKKILFAAAVMAAMMTVGCRQNATSTSPHEADTVAWYENDSALAADLAAAIDDAKALDSSKISTDLMPIRKGYPGQEWASGRWRF